MEDVIATTKPATCIQLTEYRLIYTLGPLLAPRIIPYIIAFYRELRSSSSRPTVRPLPSEAQRALNILFISTLVFLVLSLPTFAPENVFSLTQARLQTDTNVIFHRLSALRPNGNLTQFDLILKDRLQTRDGRLLYLQYGHDALSNCLFCTTTDPQTFLAYALPSILAPHLVHLAVIGLATAHTLAGPDAARWRGYAGLAGMLVAATEVYMTIQYSNTTNATAVRASDLIPFHWRARTLRYLALAVSDALLAAVVWLSATRRFFVTMRPALPDAIERVVGVGRTMEASTAKLTSLGAVRNTVMRDRRLREKLESYWLQEGQVMGEVEQDVEVMEGINKIMTIVNMDETNKRAGEIADTIMGSVKVPNVS